jgi:hypothetical protein
MKTWHAFVPAPLAERAHAWREKLDALSQRDRLALLAFIGALAAAAEFMIVLPMAAKRETVAAAAAEQMRSESEAAGIEAAAHRQRREELHAQLQAIEQELKRINQGATGGESLSALLGRLLAPQPVDIVGLKSLVVEEVNAEPAAAEAASAAAPATATAPLYRHRFELRLAGPPGRLVDSVALLDRSARPLRIDSVRLAAPERGRDADAGADARIEALITFSVTGTERSWLTL